MTERLRRSIAAHTDMIRMPPSVRAYYLALALAGEAGELGNVAKKDWRANAGLKRKALLPKHRRKMRKELADVVNYALMLGHAEGWDVLADAQRKLDAVERRKGFAQWHKPGAPRKRRKR